MRYVAAILLLMLPMSAQNSLATSKDRRLDIPAISRGANGAVVLIVVADKDGHPVSQGSGFLTSKDGHVATSSRTAVPPSLSCQMALSLLWMGCLHSTRLVT